MRINLKHIHTVLKNLLIPSLFAVAAGGALHNPTRELSAAAASEGHTIVQDTDAVWKKLSGG